MIKAILTTLVLALALLSGCGKMAAPIDLPSTDAVTSIVIATKDGTKTALTDGGEIDAIMGALKAAEPTSVQSVNDQPVNVALYLTISIYTDGKETRIYCYEKDGKVCAEQPYRGIYKLKDMLEKSFPKEKLTMDALMELSKKGASLSWADFFRYEGGYDIGFGLIILRYDIDEHYYVVIGGADRYHSPGYIRLCSADDASGIDVRKDSMEEYLREH